MALFRHSTSGLLQQIVDEKSQALKDLHRLEQIKPPLTQVSQCLFRIYGLSLPIITPARRHGTPSQPLFTPLSEATELHYFIAKSLFCIAFLIFANIRYSSLEVNHLMRRLFPCIGICHDHNNWRLPAIVMPPFYRNMAC